ATSLRMNTGHFHPIREVALQLISELNGQSIYINDENRQELKERYHQHLWKIGESVRFYENEKLISGVLMGTNESGLLQLNIDGTIRVFDIKQIKFVIE